MEPHGVMWENKKTKVGIFKLTRGVMWAVRSVSQGIHPHPRFGGERGGGEYSSSRKSGVCC